MHCTNSPWSIFILLFTCLIQPLILRPTDQKIKDVVNSFNKDTGFLAGHEPSASSSAAGPKSMAGRGRGKAKAVAKEAAPKRGRGRGRPKWMIDDRSLLFFTIWSIHNNVIQTLINHPSLQFLQWMDHAAWCWLEQEAWTASSREYQKDCSSFWGSVSMISEIVSHYRNCLCVLWDHFPTTISNHSVKNVRKAIPLGFGDAPDDQQLNQTWNPQYLGPNNSKMSSP